jgi:large subunit ribosomal protein L22
MEAKASAKNMRGSAQKARLVVDLIRGKNVAHALAILQFTHKRAAGVISKCLKSAIANANFAAEKQNIAIDPDDLWIKSCFVDIGPTKRRFRMRPAPQGRAYRERRHYCHITVEVTSEKPAAELEKDNKAKTAKENSAKRVAEKNAAPKAKKETKAAAKPKKGEATPAEDVLEIPAVEVAETAAETAPQVEEAAQEAKVETEVKAAETEAVEAKAEMNTPDVAEETIERKTESTTTETSEVVKEPSSEQTEGAADKGDKKE